MNKIAEIATNEAIAIRIKMIPKLSEAIKQLAEIGTYDHWHGNRSWSYTIVDSDKQLKITADSGRDIKLVIINY
jgi:hypothetical protein